MPTPRRRVSRAPAAKTSSASPSTRARGKTRARAASEASKTHASRASAIAILILGPTRTRVVREWAATRWRANARAFVVLTLACAATYLRDVYVPAAVRVRVTNSLPSWVNDTVLSNIPALDVQMLERPVAARRGPGVRVRAWSGGEASGGDRPGIREHGIGVVARQGVRRELFPAANVGDAGDGARVF